MIGNRLQDALIARDRAGWIAATLLLPRDREPHPHRLADVSFGLANLGELHEGRLVRRLGLDDRRQESRGPRELPRLDESVDERGHGGERLIEASFLDAKQGEQEARGLVLQVTLRSRCGPRRATT